MSTHVPGFLLFLKFLHTYVLVKLATSSIKVELFFFVYFQENAMATKT